MTWAAGVPTIWMGILAAARREPERWDLSHMQAMLVGGSAAPRAMIAGFESGTASRRARLGHDRDVAGRLDRRRCRTTRGRATRRRSSLQATAGMPLPLVEIRARIGDEEIPWDGETMGELEVRGPWVAAGYYDTPEQADRWTDDGWFRTGDIVSIDPRGFIQIKDRSKDVIKSGGEWISSVELENALMAHPAVAEAAVIAVPDAKWDERPLAAVVLREGATATADELRAFLAPHFAKLWLPERFEFIDEIPKTSVGKFRKTALREQFAQEPARPLESRAAPRGRRTVRALDLPDPAADGQPGDRARARGRRELRRRARPPRPLSADAGAAGGARSEIAGELEDGTRVMALPPAPAATRSSRRSTARPLVRSRTAASFAEGAASCSRS